MLRSFLAFAFVLLAARAPVWAQQQAPQEPQPVPDTKPARERHRVQEKLPPPPEGPWGAEDFDFTWLNPVYRGIFADVQSYSATGIELNVPHGVQGFSDGVSETLIQKLSWHDENFRSIGGRVLLDLDMIRISAGYFSGTFDATATFSVADSIKGNSQTETTIHGEAYGFRVGTYWPMIRYRDLSWDVSIGPDVNVGWLHEQVTSIDLLPPIPVQDAKDILTGSIGVEASLRAYWGRYSLDVEAEYSYMAGGARGWTQTFSAGFGIHF